MTDVSTAGSKLTDIIDFIEKLKTLNFKDAAAECCNKVVDLTQKCLMGGCLTWDDWLSILTWIRGIYDAD